MQMLRLPSTLSKTGYKKSKFYELIAQGLIPRPIKLGGRDVGWLSHELDAVLKARTAGKDDEQVRELVNQIHADRLEAK